MELARVIGTVVAERKHASLVGVRMLVVQPIEAAQDGVTADTGEPFIVADPLQAGVGDVVSWIGGREAALALPVKFSPVDAAIVTIVDDHWRDARYL